MYRQTKRTNLYYLNTGAPTVAHVKFYLDRQHYDRKLER